MPAALDSLTLPLLAQVEGPVPRSYIGWMLQSLGPFFGLAIPLAGLLVFAGACLLLARRPRAAVVAAYLAVVPVPLLIGVTGTIYRLMRAYYFYANDLGIRPRFTTILDETSMSLFPIFLGLLATWPSYLLVAIALLIRTIRADERHPSTPGA